MDTRSLKIIFAVGAFIVIFIALSHQFASNIIDDVIRPAASKVLNTETLTDTSTTLCNNGSISAKLAREIKHENPGQYLGTGSVPLFFNRLTIKQAQQLFHSKIVDSSFKCSEIKRFGKKGDGGYDVCVQEPFKPKMKNCLVYSFGINNEWSFDDHINAEYGCEVHSFDPSMHREDHVHKPNMYFHNLGIWGSNMKNNLGWEMKDLATIVKMLNHTDRIIDYAKIDVEGAEWPLLEHIVHSGIHSQIKQMVLEIHTPRLLAKSESMSLLDYGEIYNGYTELDDIGFDKFQYHANNGCCGRFSLLTPKAIAGKNLCCYETFYINKKFL